MTKEFEFDNPASKFIDKQKKGNTDNKQYTADEETKNKRLSLLVKPSVYEQFKKVATMEQESVNELINITMENVVKDSKEKIDLYDKVFSDNDQ